MASGRPFVQYQCRSCHSRCLLDHGADAAKFRECRDCYRVPDLRRERVDHRATSLMWAIRSAPLDFPSTASEGKAETARGAASAPSGAEVEADAERGLAPDRAARAHEGGPPGTTENDRRFAGIPRVRGTRAAGDAVAVQTTLGRWSDE